MPCFTLGSGVMGSNSIKLLFKLKFEGKQEQGRCYVKMGRQRIYLGSWGIFAAEVGVCGHC